MNLDTCNHVQLAVTIKMPPENRTVHRGSDVNISCGYVTIMALPVTWIINGTSFDQQEIVNSPLYQLNNPTSPPTLSLTVFSINATTTFQCVVLNLSTPVTTSTLGTVNVIGMYMYVLCMYVCIMYIYYVHMIRTYVRKYIPL